MKPFPVAEMESPSPAEPSEGRAWCPRCDRRTDYFLNKVEFLGNPVRASFFCAECGARVHPEALHREAALMRQSEGRWLRVGAASSFILMLLLPVLLAALVLYLIWRFI